MRLVIEREGGFTVVEDADAITEIDVMNAAVVLTIEVGGDKWVTTLPVKDHAEACRVSAAIAVKCGTLVEELAEAPEVDGEAAMGAASAALVRKNSKPWKPASQWVDGEPPRDGRWYVAMARYSWPVVIRREANCFREGDGTRVDAPTSHLPTPIPER